ncbi:ribonuclease H-like domain-containing protein [Xylariaceae sp. FL0804]|nr:ribonuclease H-like domain-containing protein [Xylariaceae sp. FL0804]
MIPLGRSGSARYGLNPPAPRRVSFRPCHLSVSSSSPILYPSFSMSAVPAKQQLWHPTRGIAFSPGGSRTPASPVQDTHVPRTTSPAAPRAQHVPTAVRGRGAAAYVTQPRVSPDASAGGPTQISNTVKEAIVSAAAMTAAAAVEDQCHAGGKKPPEAPPVSVYDFKMVPELYDAARNAPAGSPESFWSYKQYRGPGEDGKARDVLVHYCTNLQAMERVCREHFSHEPVLGFDLEWIAGFTKSPNIRRNVSLIQLASPGHVALFHIAVFNARDGLVAPSFKAIMEDANIIKAGVNIRGDSTRLRNNLDIHCRGLMELSHLYKLVTYSPEHRSEKINKRLVPLAQQVEEYLHLPLFKGQDVRAGNWMRLLNMNQVKCRCTGSALR